MKAVFYIGLATLLTFASSYSFGVILVRVLRLRLYRSEERLLAFVGGSAALSTLVFLIGVAGLARKSVFIAATLPVIALVLWKGWYRTSAADLPAAPLQWRAVFWLGLGIFGYLYLPHALAPEASPDGVAYHVALVAKYVREQRIAPNPISMYAHLSQGLEMLFLYAFSIGRHTAAAMVHFLFLMALPFLMVSYGRRVGHPRAGVAAALLVFASPIVGKTGTAAYVDVAAALLAFALFYVLQIWREETGNWRLLVLAGVLAGFGYGIKYPGGIGVVYLAGFVVFFTWRDPRRMLLHGGAALAAALLVMAPWLIRNWAWYSNPFSPFLTAWFPNPYIYPIFERSYVDQFRWMGGVTLPEIPIEVTVRGSRLQGLIGPIFLLAPLALLGVTRKEGRQVLLAAGVYLVPYFGNIGARFLIPALPFIATGVALAAGSFRGGLAAILAAHLFYSWPPVVPKYTEKHAWILGPGDWDAAFRRLPEIDYLKRQLPEYEMLQLLDALVKPGETVFSPGLGGRAYHRQEVMIGYESARGNRLGGVLHRTAIEDQRTTRRYTFAVPREAVRRVRVVQTQQDSSAVAIGEIRLFCEGIEVPRAPEWRLRASVNPWEVQAAFDNSALTVWTSGRATEPGMYIQIDFGSAIRIDRVTVTVPQNQGWVRMGMETDSGEGRWKANPGEPEVDEGPWPGRARRMAAEELKEAGIRWIAVDDTDVLAADLYERSQQWGIREAGRTNGIRLWRIE